MPTITQRRNDSKRLRSGPGRGARASGFHLPVVGVLLGAALTLLVVDSAHGQTARLPTGSATSIASGATRGVDLPKTNLAPINAPSFTPNQPGIAGPTTLGSPSSFAPRGGLSTANGSAAFGQVPSGQLQAPSLAPYAGATSGGGFSPAPASNALGSVPSASSANAYPGGSFIGALFAPPRNAAQPAAFGSSPAAFGSQPAGVPSTGTQSLGAPVYGGQGFAPPSPFGSATVPPPPIGGGYPATASSAPLGGAGIGGPVYGGQGYNAPLQPYTSAQAYGQPQIYGQPQAYGQPQGYGQPQPYGGFGQANYAQPGYPSSIYPSQSPTTLYPGGLFGDGLPISGAGGLSAYQLLRGPRFRYGFVGGGSGDNNLQMNDFDFSVALAWPRFLFSSQPLYVLPSFGLHLWDGPVTTASQTADLPSKVYDGFLDFSWQSDPNQIFGVELGVRVGVFTDFDLMNSDSVRVMGKGLGAFRLTPASTLKAGVYYLDRNGIKILPAVGLLWQPNPYTRFDIFFPEPKYARYWRTVGTRDVWWYLSGDYGGGSWAVKRADGAEDSVDVNDIRVMFGFEWGQSEQIRAGRRNAFFEFGYVFNREVEYRYSSQDDFTPDDGFMFRAGIGY